MAGEIAQQMRIIQEVVSQLDIRRSDNNPLVKNNFSIILIYCFIEN